jgi:hypothetical protein
VLQYGSLEQRERQRLLLSGGRSTDPPGRSAIEIGKAAGNINISEGTDKQRNMFFLVDRASLELLVLFVKIKTITIYCLKSDENLSKNPVWTHIKKKHQPYLPILLLFSMQ